MKLQFYLRFHTRFGQSLWILGNIDSLGSNEITRAIPMEYLNDEFWAVSVSVKRKELNNDICYSYFLKNEDGEIIHEGEKHRRVEVPDKHIKELHFIDTWNFAGEYENAFYTAPFQNVLFKKTRVRVPKSFDSKPTHIFKVKAPLLQKDEVVCILGSGDRLKEWSTAAPVILQQENNKRSSHWWVAKLNLSAMSFPMAYKYGVYNIRQKKFVRYEYGNNRLLYNNGIIDQRLTILHDGFIHLPNNTWKGAGVAIPVFSLRSKKSFGVGEFTDIKLLADWAEKIGLRLIQLLPINDTTTGFSWKDSYPYSVISAFALHPLYINLSKLAGKAYKKALLPFTKVLRQMNELSEVNYEAVIKCKFNALKELFHLMGEKTLRSNDFKKFFKENRYWLEPYAAFCFFRDTYGTADFTLWGEEAVYNEQRIHRLSSRKSSHYREISFYYFIQFHLHLQLKEAMEYARKKGIVLKGDIPIGISKNSCDVWAEPELFHTNWQAGAPPDDFSEAGQNWGFPTYNWKKMQENGYSWWMKRFHHMSNYFDAIRLDHILGFFRMWSIPEHAVQGIMGRFVPCLPVHISEFGENGIWFDYRRYCRPFITDEILKEIFGDAVSQVKESFLSPNEYGCYDLMPELETQKKVAQYFAKQDKNDTNEKIKQGLFYLISNVILFEEENSQGQEFHFRFDMEKTHSFKYLKPEQQQKLKSLYVNYFCHRQNNFWYREAMQKLAPLKAGTDMLICGEDLGLIPDCVPEVMRQLGLLSLEIQRMPKNTGSKFFHPESAPYLSVVTPSTHDMSTIREWWEENREITQQFYNRVLQQKGEAPFYCEPWMNKAIVLQHLYSPAMWSIFQLQDILGMNKKLRREKPSEERINNPANTHHYWRYRMHINLEDLLNEKDFIGELKDYMIKSGRSLHKLKKPLYNL